MYGSPVYLISMLMPALHVQTRLILIATLIAVFVMCNLVHWFMSVHAIPESLPDFLSNQLNALIWHADVACRHGTQVLFNEVLAPHFLRDADGGGDAFVRIHRLSQDHFPTWCSGPCGCKGSAKVCPFHQSLLGCVLLNAQPPSAKALNYWAVEKRTPDHL